MRVRAFEVKVFGVLVAEALWWVGPLEVYAAEALAQWRKKRFSEDLESFGDQAVYELFTSLLIGCTEPFVYLPALMQLCQREVGCNLASKFWNDIVKFSLPHNIDLQRTVSQLVCRT
jgi:hypothetical protein